ncbi:hypothetical protein HD806DRAFT_54577 [Xylariaceae sp. AK1471]|nr:hypothetical protein HD806DRAFT_54577 [Xylariaceae sp. AK1471]
MASIISFCHLPHDEVAEQNGRRQICCSPATPLIFPGIYELPLVPLLISRLHVCEGEQTMSAHSVVSFPKYSHEIFRAITTTICCRKRSSLFPRAFAFPSFQVAWIACRRDSYLDLEPLGLIWSKTFRRSSAIAWQSTPVLLLFSLIIGQLAVLNSGSERCFYLSCAG